MTERYLSRVRLKRDASVAALAPLLLPPGQARPAAAHHLVWALFSDGADRRRDFLWREEAPGRFMTLSARPPAAMDLFDIDTQPFAPSLAPGDHLGFVLRANAVISRSTGPGQRGRRHDVVMDVLHAMPQQERADARLGAVITAGRAWLTRQGDAHGFVPDPACGVDGYDRVQVSRETKNRNAASPAVFGTLDFTGVLQVTDPARFLAALGQGFGRARAFGCGLMLIRRVRG
jgi:CRISPR system Cascade subunit CasE